MTFKEWDAIACSGLNKRLRESVGAVGVGLVKHPASSSDKKSGLQTKYVYIDASIYKKLKLDWGGRGLKSFEEVARKQLLQLIFTDITHREVSSLARSTWREANDAARKSAAVFSQVGCSDALNIMGDEKRCVSKMVAAWGAWLRRCNAIKITLEPKFDAVLKDYFAGAAPFGPKKKKWEFPDAFVISQLRGWCSEEKMMAYVVSNDGDLARCCSSDGPLIHANSLEHVVSLAAASIQDYDAISNAITHSSWVIERTLEDISKLDVVIGPDPQGIPHDLVVASAKPEKLKVAGVYLETLESALWKCVVLVSFDLKLQLTVAWDNAIPLTSSGSTTNIRSGVIVIVDGEITDEESVSIARVYVESTLLLIQYNDIERVLISGSRSR